MIGLVEGFCALTFSVSPALVSPYGAAIDRAVVLFAEAGVTLTEVKSGADVEFKPMPPLMFPRDYGGFSAGAGVVYLRVILRQSDEVPLPGIRNLRTNVVIHEMQHQLGMRHDVIPAAASVARPVVPAVPERCKAA
jgi:hypothetical protein